MEKSLTQLTLGIGLHDEATFANFYPGKNAPIIAALKNTVTGADHNPIFLCSRRGQGLSHLLQACCHYAHQHQLRSLYFPLANFTTYTPEIFTGFEQLDLVCIDDLHVIAGDKAWEEALFHLYNSVKDAQGKLIFAAHDVPKAIHLRLPDLVSRLTWGMVYQLKPLRDDEKLIVLQMRAERRGIKMSDEVGKFILNHCPRHMSTLFAALNALDKASLSLQRKLTIPFVKDVLQI
jgi:DnaA family protein